MRQVSPRLTYPMARPGIVARMVVLKTGLSHAERCKDPLPGEFIERTSRHTVDDDRQQDVSGVAVQMFGARFEVEPHLPRQRVSTPRSVIT